MKFIDFIRSSLNNNIKLGVIINNILRHFLYIKIYYFCHFYLFILLYLLNF